MRYVEWYGRGRKQNWRTPRALFDALHAEYSFTLDGASEPENGLLPRASTADNQIDWTGERVFCNPPWSNIRPFVELAADADLAVLLVPARTNVVWFHRALELGAQARFFAGRPKFEIPGNTCNANSPVDCLLLVFRRNTP
jgi:phage N-6-adenine-methyltransferase